MLTHWYPRPWSRMFRRSRVLAKAVEELDKEMQQSALGCRNIWILLAACPACSWYWKKLSILYTTVYSIPYTFLHGIRSGSVLAIRSPILVATSTGIFTLGESMLWSRVQRQSYGEDFLAEQEFREENFGPDEAEATQPMLFH